MFIDVRYCRAYLIVLTRFVIVTFKIIFMKAMVATELVVYKYTTHGILRIHINNSYNLMEICSDVNLPKRTDGGGGYGENNNSNVYF